MKAFYAKNLVSQALQEGLPWEFKLVENITAQIRGDKEERQNWYGAVDTSHSFYTGIEGANPVQRPSKENQPRLLHFVSADYDLPIPLPRVIEAIKAMKVPPQWIERSLGGNVRLVWLFEQPLPVESYDFCVFVLQSMVTWLSLNLLPGLDEPAFTTPSRLLCNGCDWSSVAGPPVSTSVLQAFFVECGRKFRFDSADPVAVPLDIAEAQLRKQFPSFEWPGEFALDSQGPSFWIPESTSPASAVVKPNGLFTFSAHAAKPFYTWGDILGKDFVKQFADDSISKATADIWWDSKRFWRRINGMYASLEKTELLTYFKVDCRLSSKAGKDGVSQLDLALNHIFSHNRITCAVPFVFRPTGLTVFQGERKLNTYIDRSLKPAAGTQKWPDNFGWVAALLDGVFDPPTQLPYFLAWMKHYYTTAFEQVPMPGQNIFLMGGAGIGKTLINREIVGAAVGGYADASDYLVDAGQFNSHLFKVPHWCLDDDAPSSSAHAQARFQALFKKLTGNQQFLYHQKFEVAGMMEWMGRVGVTTNLDYVSSRIVGPMDNSSLDKTCLFRCPAASRLRFPKRAEVTRLILAELPAFLRWLLDWTPPDFVITDARYGYAAFQEPTLLNQTHQSSPVAPFKELLIETLDEWFKQNTEAQSWTGTVSQLMRMVLANPLNDYVVRSIKLEQTNRYLEQIQREGILRCTVATGQLKTRVWTFYRSTAVPDSAPAYVTPPVLDLWGGIAK